MISYAALRGCLGTHQSPGWAGSAQRHSSAFDGQSAVCTVVPAAWAALALRSKADVGAELSGHFVGLNFFESGRF